MNFKKLFLLFIGCFATLFSYAQFTAFNSLMRRAIVMYETDEQGYYVKKEIMPVVSIDNITEMYALNKKTLTLYATTATGNFAITLDKSVFKNYKKAKTIPMVSGADLQSLIDLKSATLVKKCEAHNQELKYQEEQRIRREREEAERRKKEEAEKAEKARKEKEEYRRSHIWNFLPVPLDTYKCELCEKEIKTNRLYCIGIQNDSILSIHNEPFDLGYSCTQIHVYKLTDDILEHEAFQKHATAFVDSLGKTHIPLEEIEYFNADKIDEVISKIKKAVPWGYVSDYSWDNENYVVTLKLTFRNLNAKTIRYIQVFYNVLNDVGDVRTSGSFKGTGPIKQYDAGTWDWDYDSSYTFCYAGDATRLRITKIILTYMDGKKKILTGNQILIGDGDDETDEIPEEIFPEDE